MTLRLIFINAVVVLSIICNGMTPSEEIRKDHIEIQKLDLSKYHKMSSQLLANAQPLFKDYPLIHIAVCNGDYKLVSKLIKSGVSVNEVGGDFIYPLDIAIVNNDLEMIKFLIKTGASVNRNNVFNYESIICKIIAIDDIKPEIIHYFFKDVKIPLDFDDCDEKSNPLRMSINKERDKIFSFLLENKDIVEKYGLSALEEAAWEKRTKYYKMLKEKGVEDNLKTLLASPESDSFKILQKMNINADDLIDIAAIEEFGPQAIHWAIVSNDPRKINLVLKFVPESINSLFEGSSSSIKSSIIGLRYFA